MNNSLGIVILTLFLTGVEIIQIIFLPPRKKEAKIDFILFLSSIMGVILLFLFQSFFNSFFNRFISSDFLNGIIQAFFTSALWEEGVKTGLFYLFFLKSTEKSDLKNILKKTISILLGFILMENIFYILNEDSGILFSRLIFSTPLHFATTLTAVYLIYRKKSYLVGLSWAWAIHGLNNFLLICADFARGQHLLIVEILCIFFSIVLVWSALLTVLMKISKSLLLD